MSDLCLPPGYAAPPDALAGRVVVVTGAGDGLGRAAALALAAHGARLVLVGRTPRKLEAVYDEIEALGAPTPLIHPMDLAGCDAGHYADLAAALEARCERLDALVHAAAAFAGLCPLEHHEVLDWAESIQVNLHAPFLLTRALLGLLRRAPCATVLFTADAVGRHARAYWGAYAVAKAGIEALCQVLADEVRANTAIRVTSFDPGPVRTALRARAYPGEDPALLREPAELAPFYVYLLAAEPDRFHGEALTAAWPAASGA